MKSKIIELYPNRRITRPVKAAALATFRLVRKVTAQGQEFPARIDAVLTDIRDAWHESARPYVSDQVRD